MCGGYCDGRDVRWFRRRPSDDEMQEELESHVALRTEHDCGTSATARRRLGNMLQTRESMRRIWIAEWWDALKQDAHFTGAHGGASPDSRWQPSCTALRRTWSRSAGVTSVSAWRSAPRPVS